jgi:nucleoside-diphosphate kinase
MERTLAIIKPDSVAARNVGAIVGRIEQNELKIVALRSICLTREEAEGFYAVHRGKPFFDSLTAFMSSGPAVVLVLESPDAIRRWRDLMGATDPSKADEGTIRREFGASIERNATHGSDASDTAAYEVAYFFPGVELP